MSMKSLKLTSTLTHSWIFSLSTLVRINKARDLLPKPDLIPLDPILSDLEKDDLAWATEEEDGLNIEELDLAFLLSLECFDPSKPIDKQEEDKLGDSWEKV